MGKKMSLPTVLTVGFERLRSFGTALMKRVERRRSVILLLAGKTLQKCSVQGYSPSPR